MSNLVFLGFSVILFIVSYGIMFLIAPIIFGSLYNILDDIAINDPGWSAIYEQNKDLTKFLVPLIPTVGIVIFLIKVLLVASVKGRD